ncbi:MAG: plasmid maintenance system killer protein [Ruminococcaceae bacterium]|nr:plasmid maintenance system killer protein [Oscillospiraceae bacterium]
MCYKSKNLERVCTILAEAKKQHGMRMANLIHQRVEQIQAASSIEELVKFSIGRCHPLKENRKGEFAMDLVHPYRLVFVQVKDQVEVVRIIMIEDYH